MLLVVSIAQHTAGQIDPAAALATAADQARNGNYTPALASCQKVIAATDDVSTKGRAQFLAGYCEYKLKHPEAAFSRLRNASELFPELSYHALYYSALAYQEASKYDEAVLMWEKLIAAKPPGDLTGRALMELLRCHRRSKDAAAAASVLDRLKTLARPDPAWIHEREYTRAWTKVRLGAESDARSRLLQLWRDHPESFWADQALKLLETEKSLLLPGESSILTEGERLRRIQVLIDKNRPSKALTELNPIIAKAEKSSMPARLASLYKTKGVAYEGKREFTNAITYYKKSQALTKAEDVEILYFIARSLRRANKYQEAIVAYRDLTAKYPGGPYATRGLFYSSRLMKLTNDWAGAEAGYKKLVTQYPHSTLRAESLFQIAWIRYLREDYAKAKIYFERVPNKSKDKNFNMRTLYWKSVLQRKLGETQKAEEAEKLILTKHWDTAYAFYLIMCDGRKWPYQKVSKVIPKPENNPPIEFRLATELYQLGLAKDAEGQLKALEQKGRLPEWLVWQVAKMYTGLEDYNRAMRLGYKHLKPRLKSPPPGEPEAWRLLYPQAYREHVVNYSEKYDLDPLLVWSLMRAESTYRPAIRSSAGATGLMQIMPATGTQIARGLGEKGYKKSKLKDPQLNIRYGTYYLHGRMEQFGPYGDTTETRLKTVTRSLAAYNAGPNRSLRWGKRADELGLPAAAFVEEIPFKETREYVKRILGYYLIYLSAWPKPVPNATEESSP